MITAESQAEVSEAVPLPQESILPFPAPVYSAAMQAVIGMLVASSQLSNALVLSLPGGTGAS